VSKIKTLFCNSETGPKDARRRRSDQNADARHQQEKRENEKTLGVAILLGRFISEPLANPSDWN
jgi:hypothetical protein